MHRIILPQGLVELVLGLTKFFFLGPQAMKGAREDTMAKKVLVLLALIIALAGLAACQEAPPAPVVQVTVVVPTRDIEVEAAVLVAAVKDAVQEGVAAAQPTATHTPRPTATATPDAVVAAAATLAASGIEVQLPPPAAATDEGSGAPAPTGTVSAPPAPAGEDDTQDHSPAAPAAGEENQTFMPPANGVSAGSAILWGFPEEAVPARWAGVIQPENPCTGAPPMGCWLFAQEGVLSFDHANGSDELNRSAVWSGGADVTNLVTNHTESFTIPEGGYMKFTTGQAVVEIPAAGLGFQLPAEEGVAYNVVIRGFFYEEGRGLADVYFSVENPGSLHVMRYPVDPEFSGFYSIEHNNEDVQNQLGGLRPNADNCDSKGCDVVYRVGIDINNLTVTVWRQTRNNEVELVFTNVVPPQGVTTP